MASTFYDVRLS